MLKEVLFIADDFGMNETVNEAILHAHHKGALHRASLMMGQPATAHAISMARQSPALQVGLHVHLNDSTPCTRPAWPWNISPAKAGWAIALLPWAAKLMQHEIARQWELFQASNLRCDFVNSHHHLHFHPAVAHALHRTLGTSFDGWIRFGKPRSFSQTFNSHLQNALIRPVIAWSRRKTPWPSSDTVWGIDRLFAMNAVEVSQAIQSLGSGRHEFLFHPRHPNDHDTQCLLALSQSA